MKNYILYLLFLAGGSIFLGVEMSVLFETLPIYLPYLIGGLWGITLTLISFKWMSGRNNE